MLKVALTGNRYSGKSKICNMFSGISISVFDADNCIKFLLHHNFEFALRLKKALPDFFDSSHSLDKSKMNTVALNKAIDIIESELFLIFDKFCRKQKDSIYVIFKSSILFERNWDEKFDFVITVYAPVHDRIERCRKITNLDYIKIYDLVNGEILDEVKKQSSDFSISNYDGCKELFKSVNEIDSKLIDHFLNKKI